VCRVLSVVVGFVWIVWSSCLSGFGVLIMLGACRVQCEL